jgi:transposase
VWWRSPVDALGDPARFLLLPGRRHGSVGAGPPIAGIEFGAPLGDEASDSDGLRAEPAARGAAAAIPPEANRVEGLPCDLAMCRWRHLVESFSCRPERFRRVAARYDETDESFTAMIHPASSILALRRMSTRPSSTRMSWPIKRLRHPTRRSGVRQEVSRGDERAAGSPCPLVSGGTGCS